MQVRDGSQTDIEIQVYYIKGSHVIFFKYLRGDLKSEGRSFIDVENNSMRKYYRGIWYSSFMLFKHISCLITELKKVGA